MEPSQDRKDTSLASQEQDSHTSTTSSDVQLTFKPIAPEDTIPLRHLVLWPSISLDKQLIPEYDFNPKTIHLGAFKIPNPNTASQPTLQDPTFDKDHPIGVLTLAAQRYPSFSGEIPVHIQLHKFAVHPSLQGKGIGRQLLSYAIEILRQRYPDQKILFHFDARVSQIRFYERSGMSILDEKTFWKYGSTGKGEGVEYVKMGRVL
ncbi:hypothetical protein I302_108921 [Kwoniella bestiolae CBS 10118]|uniref:N-acetyltransferase domain-containing protein n=1 Tax=Kwoniella bestiolae CBS 10118 TaxID=1296100 RepID=A0A1B9FUH5_9TREE|nr:hypothetical protein I302_08062 [Kwoniella bestiolae CBS 10118]OCF22414.1 hypothetical protein I302_08062 [Kwoniella bestiolae CBS 10118]